MAKAKQSASEKKETTKRPKAAKPAKASGAATKPAARRKTAAATTAKRATAKRPAAKKTVAAKKAPARKAPAKKATVKEPAARKVAAKKVAVPAVTTPEQPVTVVAAKGRRAPAALETETAARPKRVAKRQAPVEKETTVATSSSATRRPARTSRQAAPAVVVVPPAAIDTEAAAAVAANLLLNHTPLTPVVPAVIEPESRPQGARKARANKNQAKAVAVPVQRASSKRETGTFKQLKASLANTPSRQIAAALGTPAVPEADPFRPFGGYLPAKGQVRGSVNPEPVRANVSPRKGGGAGGA
ncbi:MAG TPA: hypothetical protein VFB66_22330 [Tepidisphaeraceae bacterium]|nr:hypothetical protein [Tepidisphaeraceae bacterium]